LRIADCGLRIWGFADCASVVFGLADEPVSSASIAFSATLIALVKFDLYLDDSLQLAQLSLPEGARKRKALVIRRRTKKVCTKISYCSIQPHFPFS